MSVLESELALGEDLVEVRRAAADLGWTIVSVDGVTVVVDVCARTDGELYRLRLVCEGYPERAPSIHPIDPATGRSDVARAWPACDGFRPVSDLCLPLSAEGFALHPAWAADPSLRWIPTGNPLLRVLEELQARLNDPAKYRGRTV